VLVDVAVEVGMVVGVGVGVGVTIWLAVCITVGCCVAGLVEIVVRVCASVEVGGWLGPQALTDKIKASIMNTSKSIRRFISTSGIAHQPLSKPQLP